MLILTAFLIAEHSPQAAIDGPSCREDRNWLVGDMIGRSRLFQHSRPLLKSSLVFVLMYFGWRRTGGTF